LGVETIPSFAPNAVYTAIRFTNLLSGLHLIFVFIFHGVTSDGQQEASLFSNFADGSGFSDPRRKGMRQFAIMLICVLALMFAACGSGNNSNNVNGNWSASLMNTDGTPAFSFTTSLNQSNSTTITGTSLTFTTATPCFSSGGTETGGFTLTGSTGGMTTGNFELTIQSGTPSGNVLTLQGTDTNNVISGSWTLTGVTSGCTGSGTFTMNRM